MKTYQIGTHKTSIFTDEVTDLTHVKYHATSVVKFNKDIIILNSGGWHTNTTKLRMNQTSNQFGLGYTVFQKDFSWFVSYKNETYDFRDNMVIVR